MRRLEKPVVTFELNQHTDTITGLSLSPDDKYLLSNGMDSLIIKWDVQPFVLQSTNRCITRYSGVHHGQERNLLRCNWSPNGSRVVAGSADR